ncbi:hypothetical protein MHM89_01200 [Pseudoalteromonas sp. CNC9-20]|uniref:glycoside hydrolase family protein n=1 Tax=Pseudoalteromonas sp. CNC9-20 TaxID=2917750 RepID=UPI001EF6B75A|nr:hypothetical protein [Pseudoalteromonas sp. CNC9-20]MCG7568532.1 hypothetical protein [Pseudoalteromonas sp. CNC9-20]
MKLNKLKALGLTAALAFTGVSVSQFEGEELTGYLDLVGVATACYGHTKPPKWASVIPKINA